MKNIITQIRELTGLSRAAFSKAYGIPVRTLENWESGVNEAPDYTIDLLARVALEDSGKYEEIVFEVISTRTYSGVTEEFEEIKTNKITKAISEAKTTWEALSPHDKKYNDIEVRLYFLSEESREDSDNWDADLIEWR